MEYEAKQMGEIRCLEIDGDSVTVLMFFKVCFIAFFRYFHKILSMEYEKIGNMR